MNRIFRIIWSKSLNTWVIASELATRCGKGASVDKRVDATASVAELIAGGSWRLRLVTLAVLATLYAPVQAADRYWDVNGSGVGLGGTGTWNTAPGFWSDSSDGVSGPFTNPWNNAAPGGDNAIFGGTGGTVTLGAPITVHNLTFGTAYTLTGGTLTLVGTAPTIDTVAGTTTINSVLAGVGGLTKAGAGTLTLNGVNTFSGGLNVTAGGLVVAGDSSLGAASNGIALSSGASLRSTGALAAGRVVTLLSGSSSIGGGVGSAHITGAGGFFLNAHTTLSDNTNNFTGSVGTDGYNLSFTSIRNLGEASALGAPTTAANGAVFVRNAAAIYLGSGDTSNRSWNMAPFTFSSALRNQGTGTLTVTGDITAGGGYSASVILDAQTADLALLGVISSNLASRPFIFMGGGTNRTITLNGSNSFGGAATIQNVTVRANSLADQGTISSLGTGAGASTISLTSGVLAYTGTGNSSNRGLWISGGSSVLNDGTGALTLSGAVAFNPVGPADFLTLGGSYAGANTLSGVVSGAGNLVMNGAAGNIWRLSGANTYNGTTTVASGTLQAGSSQAFGAPNAMVVNGGTLDLNDFAITAASLSGTGGAVDLGSGNLTLNAASGSTSYAGNITGSGGLTKLGLGTQTLTGANTYTGATNIGAGTLALNFAGAGGPISNIVSGASTLNMSGGTLTVTGAAGEANVQNFNGLNVTAGSNRIGTTPGTGGTVTVNLGGITRSGGLIDFGTSASGIITTANADGTLGGWATVNGSDYAKVQGGSIVAFTAADYTNKDDAGAWLDNEFISDAGGAVNTPYFGTVAGSKQLGGLQYTAAANSTVNVSAGQTLGIDGSIIVTSTVGNTAKTIQGGNLTGLSGGGTLGVLQNGGAGSNFTIASTIVDNTGAIGFSKGGTAQVTLTGANTYTGATTLSGGTLSINSVANAGTASSIGASSVASSNLVIENGTLSYTGASASTDRGFTLVNGGPSRTIEVTNGATNVAFNGVVTSPDDAGFIKTGAGTLTLGNAGNNYVGVTTVSNGTLSVGTLTNGGLASGIGAASSDATNLVINAGANLEYTGGTTTSDRSFTLGAGAAGGGIDVDSASTTLTLSGVATGTGALRKEGAGTLILSGANTYSGGTIVNTGILRAGATNVFGTGAAAVNAGATLQLANFNNSVGYLTGAGTVDLGSATLTLNSGATVPFFTGTITGTGGITRTGGLTQAFSGCNNTYTGATQLAAGRLTVDCLANGGQASAIGASSAAASNLAIGGGAELVYTGSSINIDRGATMWGGDGTISVSSAATTLGMSGQITGGGRLRKGGAGVLVLSGTNNYSGDTVVDGGILRAGSTSAFGAGGIFMQNVAGATLDLANNNNSVLNLQGGGALGGNVTLGSATLTITNGSNATYAGAISGTGGVRKSGGPGAVQVLSGCVSSYAGSTVIDSGGIMVTCLGNGGSNSSIGASSAAASNLVLNGGYLQYNGAGNSTDRQFTLGGSASLYSSGTGAIAFTSTAAVAQAGTVNAPRTLTLRGANTGNNILAAQLTNNGTGATSLTKDDGGTWILTNPNSTYTGITTINGGVLGVDKLSNGGVASSLGASSAAATNLVIGNGSTLRYTGTGDTTNRLFTLSAGTSFIESSGTGAIVFTDTGPVTLQTNNAARTIALGGTNTGNNTLAGSIGNAGTGVTTLAKNDSGTWVLTGNNTFTGNTVINDGNLVIGNGGTTGNAGAGNVIVNAPTSTLSINRSDAFNFTGTLSGPGTLAQIGTGTTVLTSASNSIGATTISAGTLEVNGVLATPTIALNGASTLTVNGTVQGTGGTASTITGDGGNSTINVNATLLANGNLGAGSDVVNLTGTLDTGAAALNLGDGNDTLALNDGSVIAGVGVDGGLGAGDILQVNNAVARTIGGTQYGGFERLVKQSAGVLTATGTHTYSAGTDIVDGTLDVDGSVTTPAVTMADGTTLNVDGTLEAAGGTAATLTGSAGVNTVLVNTAATLRANGDLGDGDDTVTLGGTLDTGAAALNLGSGDDTVTLNDGAVLAGIGLNAGAQTTSDVLILNNALGLSFDGSRTAGFENLIKQNTGTATMAGTQTFSAGTEINGGVLDIDGSLTTPSVTMLDGTALNVDGALQGIGATAAAITGSNGVNTVTITGTAIASGDLGSGNDTLDVAGTLDLDGGVFALGDGDDNFVVHDGTNVIGTIDGGTGLDSRVYDINATADLGALVNFEGVTKAGTGTLNINGPGTTDLQDVQVLGGTLNIGGSVVATAGSALNTVVGSGATLNVDGSYGCGGTEDTMSVSGAVAGSGTIDLCGSDDVLRVNDGADFSGFIGTISGGAGNVGDRIVLNNAAALSFGPGNLTGFEFLEKENSGEATLTGNQSYSGGVGVHDGTLTIGAGASLNTPRVVVASDTTLNVVGDLQGISVGSATQILGDIGAQTINITGTALATGDLAEGNDVVDVTGTLDTNGGTFALGDGNDSFVVHDGSNIIGTIDGGAGLDSRVYDINTTANLGAMVNFEGVTKTGTGTLNITGPGTTDLQDVQVLGGTLNIGAAGSVAATAGSALNTVVGSGATLNVDGSFGCGAQADTMSVSGTVSGTGTVNLCGGDDTLTLNDGAVLANVIDGDAGTADTVVLNNAGAMNFDGSNTTNFEVLRKNNTGEATLTGASTFTGGTQINGGALTVDGSLTTPTLAMADGTALNVDGAVQGMGGTAATITGSAGVNTVTIAAGATLTATGDLGDGSDVLDAAGIIDTDGGSFSLGAGDDTFNVYDTTDTSLATIDGGAGNDLLDVNVGAGNTVPLGGLLGFESLGKSGAGVLEIQGASSFIDVALNAGTLRVTDTGSVAATNTTILSGATLELADGGSYSGTTGDDTFTVAGTVVSTGSNTGTIDLGDGNDTFTIQDGANLSGLAQPVSGGAGTDTFVADLAGTATLGGAVSFETLNKTNTGTLIVAGPALSTFSTVNVAGGTLDVGVAGSLTGVQTATVASGATLNVDGVFGFTAGADSFTVAGTVTGASAIDMLDGDDTFTIQDGANLSGLSAPIDGGAGTDAFVADLAGTATLGGAVNFETLNKTNTGTLIVAGPAASSFSTVNVAGGTLDIAAAGSISGVVTGTVAGGATLNVDGSYAGSAGDDSLTIAGAVTGNGGIAFDNGDDTLTLNDGADLSAFNGTLDGGAHSTGDRVVLNNAGAMNFHAANISNFEFLQKDNTGEATLTGNMSFSGGTLLNNGTLTVAGDLTTPSLAMTDNTALNVGGMLQGAGGTAADIIGSSGLNTVTITGTAIASGDLGAGNDVLDVAGTLDTNGGTFALGDGDDDFIVHDGTIVAGTIDGGAGLDSRVYDIAGTAEFGALLSFEGVTKRGTGTLNISGPGATDLQSVEVEGGTLNIGAAGSVVASAGTTLTTVVASGATLNVEGSFGCGAGNDTMTVAGTVSGAGTVGMCGGDDTLTLQDGATLTNIIDGGADTDTVVLDTATAMSFNGANTTNFEVLQKDNLGEATLTGTANFSGGTLLNGGTLTVAGDLTTPTLAMSDGTTLNVAGTVQGGSATAITGSNGVNTVNVTGTLSATGDLGAGNDVLDVTGTLNTGAGTLALGDGDDTLTIHDGTNLIGTVAAGAGNDTFNTNIATSANLGAVQGFETLSKTGAGTLNVNGPMSSDFATVNVLAGTLNVASGGSVAAQTSTVAAGATLQIAGTYSGTAGDDSFTSMGTVRGALSFGTGADTASFVGGDISGLTGLDGGAGTSDRLSFSGLTLGDSNLTAVTGWERVELLNASALTLGTAFNLGSGVLAIDATSQLTANAGARITGNVENAGLINAGGTRLAISGNYTSNAGALRVIVSPGNATSGGLDIAGDVVGNTRVTFASDRSIAPEDGPTSIQVISSANDNAATAGGFVPDSADGIVRLEGSVTPWTFGKQADNNWYLSTEADALLPEVAGYGVLPSLGTLLSQQSGDLVHQRLAGVRNNDPQCEDEARGRAGADLIGDCEGAWVAATASELELGANPGFAVSGDDVGLYVGFDGDLERDTRTLRVGGYLGYAHGVYWASGANSTDLQGMGPARVDIDTPVVGVYANTQWHNGNYLDVVLSGHRPNADIRTADGFTQHVTGNYLTVSARAGRSVRLDHGWTLEPQLQLTASQMHWQDTVDAAGRELLIDDDLVGTARAGVRVEKAFTTAGGATITPWMTLAVQNVIGEKETGMTLSQPGSTDPALAFPNHDLGTSASLDVGVEAKLGNRISVFGVLSIGQEMEGTDVEQRAANVGVRARW